MSEVKLSKLAKSVKPGIYIHYKGGKYKVSGVCLHSETLEELVIYEAQYGEKLRWVRPIKMFLENVMIDGKEKPRFKFLKKAS